MKILQYHIHVYYDLETKTAASALRDEVVSKAFAGARVSKMWDRPIGPHTKPMFEIDLPVELYGVVTKFLRENSRGLSMLVHEVTGDDPRDHAEGASWIGSPVPIDYTKLDPSPA